MDAHAGTGGDRLARMITPKQAAAAAAQHAAQQAAAKAQGLELRAQGFELMIDHYLGKESRVILSTNSSPPEALPLRIPSEVLELLESRYRAGGWRTTLANGVLTIEPA